MLYAHIVPTAYLNELDKYNTMHLVLAQHIGKDEEYTDFYRSTDKYKILDNGAYENKFPVSIEELIEKACFIGADEIIIPDVFMDCDETLKLLDSSLKYIIQHDLDGHFKLMVAPQGKTNAEYMKCLGIMQAAKEVDVIGLSFLVVAQCFKEISACEDVLPNRQMLTKLIQLLGFHDKQYHLLGLGNCKELEYQKQYSWIRGGDSSSAFVHGINDIKFDKEKGLTIERVKTKLNFGVKNLHLITLEKIKRNMEVINVFSGNNTSKEDA
jgi:hypothetical protein